MIKKALISFAVIVVAFIAIIAMFLLGGGAAPSQTTPPGGPPPPGSGTVEGRVLLGPTCPVERIPPLPGCAPKPYATAILVFAAGNNTSPIDTLDTDASGTFAIALPAGAYVLQAKGGSASNPYYPHCGSAEVTVKAGMTATTTLSCDTGIR